MMMMPVQRIRRSLTSRRLNYDTTYCLQVRFQPGGTKQKTMKGIDRVASLAMHPDAPIFKVANYGLVDDLFKVMPELTEKVKAK